MSQRVSTLIFVLSSASGCWNGTATIGDPCEEKQECESGLCLQEMRYGAATGWLDGYCTRLCENDCSAQEVCASFEDASYCLTACRSDGDCRYGYLCHPEVQGCLPDCRMGFDCGAGSCGTDGLCAASSSTDEGTDHGIDTSTLDRDTENETRTASDSSTLGDVGAACSLNAQCLSGLCLPEQPTHDGVAWQDGMCVQPCGACPAGSTCAVAGPSELCLPECSNDDDCRSGYVCEWETHACIPDCRIGFPCAPGTMCSGRGTCSGQGGPGGGP